MKNISRLTFTLIVIFVFSFSLAVSADNSDDSFVCPRPPQLVVSLVSNQSTASQFLPVGRTGASNLTKGVFNFGSVGKKLVVTELKFTIHKPNTVTIVTAGGASAPVINGYAYLTGLSVVVPAGGSINLDVLISYSGVDGRWISSGTLSHIALEYVKYTGGITSTLCTRDMGRCDGVMNAVSAPNMKLVGSVPTLTLSSSGATLIAGMVDVGHVNISTNANGNVSINQLPVNVNITAGVVADSSSVLVKDGNGYTIPTYVTVLHNEPEGFKVVIHFMSGYTLSAGTSQAFKMFVRFDSVGGATPIATMSLGSPALFAWTDLAGGARFPFTVDNSVFFYNYPANSVVVVGTPVGPSLNVVANPNYSVFSYPKWVQAARIGSYQITASVVEGVRLWSTSIGLGSGANLNYRNLILLINGVQVGGIYSDLSSGGVYTFQSNQVVLFPGSTITVDVLADVLSSAITQDDSATRLVTCAGNGMASNIFVSCNYTYGQRVAITN